MMFVNWSRLLVPAFLFLAIVLPATTASDIFPVRSEQAATTAQAGPDFEMTAAQTNLTLLQDAWIQTTLSIKSIGGFAGNVQLWLGGMGPYLSGDNPVYLAPGTSQNVTAQWLSYDGYGWIQPGVYYSSVTGTSLGLSHKVVFWITVVPRPYFTLSVPVRLMTIQAGTSLSTVVTVTGRNGFSSRVEIGANGFGTTGGGITGKADPLLVGVSKSTTLTITADRSVAPGNYTVLVNGDPIDSQDAFFNGTSFTLRVLPAAPQPTSTLSSLEDILLSPAASFALLVPIALLLLLLLRNKTKRSTVPENMVDETPQPWDP